MNRTLFAIFGFVLCLSWADAAPVTTVDLTRSEIKFISKQMNVPVEGAFRKFEVEFKFDPTQSAQSHAKITVEIASIDTGSTEGDSEVQRKPWFNASDFPKVKFISSAVKALGGEKYEVTGELTIKGKTKTVTAPFLAKAVTGGTLLQGEFKLNRKDFGIGDGVWDDPDTVAHEVQVKFKFFGKPK